MGWILQVMDICESLYNAKCPMYHLSQNNLALTNCNSCKSGLICNSLKRQMVHLSENKTDGFKCYYCDADKNCKDGKEGEEKVCTEYVRPKTLPRLFASCSTTLPCARRPTHAPSARPRWGLVASSELSDGRIQGPSSPSKLPGCSVAS